MRTAVAFRGAETSGEPRPAMLYVPTGSGARSFVVQRLARVGVPLAAAVDVGDALRLLAARPVALALVDLGGDRAALAAIRAIRAKHRNVAVAAVVDQANPLLTGEAVQAGALDFIPWPFEDRDVLTVFANACELAVTGPADRVATHAEDERLVAQSAAMRAVVERIESAAGERRGLFICGEAGSGRSIVAREIHRIGQAPHVGWVIEDCANRTPDELDRRLFGVVSEGRKNGTRTAAFERISRTSALYHARGGTLVLKNLVDAPARVQTRLARLMRDREVELADQVGTLVDLDVRVIASVDATVSDAVGDGRMRPDLFERLSHARIDVPPLRRRREDVPVLAVQFLTQACEVQDVPLKGISRSALKLLTALPWHGNGRELRALIDMLVRVVERPVVQLDDLLEHASFESTAIRMDAGVSLRDAKARFERECISAVLARHHGRVGDAAKALGIQRTNLYRKVRQLQVTRPRQIRRTDR